MKKFKIIAIIVLVFLVGSLFLGNCKKTKALDISEHVYTISERSQSQYNFVCAFDFSTLYNDNNITDFNFLSLNNYTNNSGYYFNIDKNNVLRFYSFSANNVITLLESVSINGRLLQFNIVYDVNYLYVIVYQLLPNIQTSQGLGPSFDGFSRNMIIRHSLSHYYDLTNDWSDNNIKIYPLYNSAVRTANALFNCAYISSTDTINDINAWVNKQFSNSNIINYVLTLGYNDGYSQGYDEGYVIGTSDGEDTGYSEGYDEGYDSGYSAGTIDGHQEGYIDGYNVGYDIGYDEGQEGENAISPVFRIISDIFGSIGSIMAIELVPHVPLGLFILVPLFFSVLGLILWIWRRN